MKLSLPTTAYAEKVLEKIPVSAPFGNQIIERSLFHRGVGSQAWGSMKLSLPTISYPEKVLEKIPIGTI